MRTKAALVLLALSMFAQGAPTPAIPSTADWQTIPLPARALGITAHDGALWVVGADELVAVSRDDAKSWQVLHHAPRGAALYCLTFLDARNAVAMGDHKAFLVTHDGGATWSNTHHGPDPTVYQAAFGDATHVVADAGVWFLDSSDLKPWRGVLSSQITPNHAFLRVASVAGVDAQHLAVLFYRREPAVAQYVASSMDGGRRWNIAGYPTLNLDSLVVRNGEFVAAGEDLKPTPHSILLHSTDAVHWRRDPDLPLHYGACTSQGCLAGTSGQAHIAWIDLQSSQPRYGQFTTAQFARSWAVGRSVICQAFGSLECTTFTSMTSPPLDADNPTPSPNHQPQPSNCVVCLGPVVPFGSLPAIGTVTMHMVIRADGHLGPIKVDPSANVVLAALAVKTVEKWILYPIEVDGKLVDVDTSLSMVFKPK